MTFSRQKASLKSEHSSIKAVQEIVAKHWNIQDVTVIPMASEWGGTYKIDGEHQYLLKISPAHVSQNRIEMEVAVANHLARNLKALTTQRIIPTIRGEDLIHTELGTARLFSWIEGKLWAEIKPHDPPLLEKLGHALGHLTKALQNFDHPGAHEDFIWSLENNSWREDLQLLPSDLMEITTSMVDRYDTMTKTRTLSLRSAVNYHDANDYNILVDKAYPGHVMAFIDYGDCFYAPVVNDLAVCMAYALTDQPDILGAARLIAKGFHAEFPLREEELEVTYDLLCMRLVISLVHAAKRHAVDPAKEYWQVSTASGENLLRSLHLIHPHLMLCYLRSACGFEPSPDNQQLISWLKSKQFAPILGINLTKEKVAVFDWSVAGTALGSIEELKDVEKQTFDTFHRMQYEGVKVGVGRYDEPRPIYTTEEYQVPGLHVPAMRTIHLGIDLIMPAGTPLYAPLDGEVMTLVNNEGDKEYGPLVILRHKTDDGQLFYTLYGHNNIYTLSLLKKGQRVRAGEKIAEIGSYPENGNWVPHVHFQIMTHLLDYADDYPGVASPDVRDIWLSLCPDPNLMLGIKHPELKYHYTDIDGLHRKRKKILGSNLSLSYQQPLHIVRGWKTLLYDEYGRTYLDTVNNIAHVGHEHPHVVKAGRQQMAVLNTNTRYLHRQILTLAQQLLETLPGHLEVVYFVNSGSEANELALRMARHFTGRKETLVLEEGYHGNTQACLEVSHYKFKKLRKEEYVSVVPMRMYMKSEVSRLPAVGQANFAKGNSDRSNEFSEVVNFAKANFAKANFAKTVFIHESLPSCAGQLVPHEDFFMDMYAEVKRQGGVCIADEVQTGLGRTGSHYSAFELYTIAPDIVTIGKPLGNGHPIAAVACTRAIAEAFAKGPEFFSSFGGNPVSCAIASSVLDVIEKEQLQAHALSIGNFWLEQLRQLQREHPVIGDVRGHGLFLGIEFVDPETGAPSKKHTEYIVKRMLDHRILTSLDGPENNVMKIKPPMSIGEEEVAIFIKAFGKILYEMI